MERLLQDYALVIYVIESQFKTPPFVEVELRVNDNKLQSLY